MPTGPLRGPQKSPIGLSSADRSTWILEFLVLRFSLFPGRIDVVRRENMRIAKPGQGGFFPGFQALFAACEVARPAR
jgi:hypothetical protein